MCAQVAPALQINGKGKLVRRDTRQPADLHGFNAFGWNNWAFNVFDGLWAYCDGEQVLCRWATPIIGGHQRIALGCPN